MNKDMYELVARIRDHYQQAEASATAIVDVCTRILGVGEKQVFQKYDMSKINHEPKEGTKGTYNLATKNLNPNNPDFDACLADLKQHDGKPIRHQGFFIWLIGDEFTAFGFKPVKEVKKKEATEAPLAPTPPTPAPTPASEEKKLKMIVDVKAFFPADLADMLLFEETEAYITIKPRQYLGSDNFAKIAAIVRDQAGEYISAGKESHFRIPR